MISNFLDILKWLRSSKWKIDSLYKEFIYDERQKFEQLCFFTVKCIRNDQPNWLFIPYFSNIKGKTKVPRIKRKTNQRDRTCGRDLLLSSLSLGFQSVVPFISSLVWDVCPFVVITIATREKQFYSILKNIYKPPLGKFSQPRDGLQHILKII